MKQPYWFITCAIIGIIFVSGCTTVKIAESTATDDKPNSLNRSVAYSPQTRAKLKQLGQLLSDLKNELVQSRAAREGIFASREILLAQKLRIRLRIAKFGIAYNQLDASEKNADPRLLDDFVKYLETAKYLEAAQNYSDKLKELQHIEEEMALNIVARKNIDMQIQSLNNQIQTMETMYKQIGEHL